MERKGTATPPQKRFDEVEIRGVKINFPFQPYDVQVSYMDKVIECLQTKSNGILESPTGTGKTLSLLCSTLGWLELKKAELQAGKALLPVGKVDKEPDFLAEIRQTVDDHNSKTFSGKYSYPKIIYSSRTHSQISQVIGELKRSSYSYVKSAVIGSREQLCIDPVVSQEPNNTNKIHLCRHKVKTKTCMFYNNVEKLTTLTDFNDKVMDIEDLVTVGKKKNCCPYFLARKLASEDADITFMPYNYLIDPKSRKAQGIDIQGNIIIFDEAHNIEKACEDSSSVQFRLFDISTCIQEITAVMKHLDCRTNGDDCIANPVNSLDGLFKSPEDDFALKDLALLKVLFCEFEEKLDAIRLVSGAPLTLPGSRLFSLLHECGLTTNNMRMVVELLDKLMLFLTSSERMISSQKGRSFQVFSDILQVLFKQNAFSSSSMDTIFKLHVSEEKNPYSPLKATKMFNFWCFCPGFGMRDIINNGAYSIVLTSGSLAPVNSFVSELMVPFPVQLENPHVVGRTQVWAGVIGHTPDGVTPLNTNFNTRGNMGYMTQLGRLVEALVADIPYGVLLFFPSYTYLNDCKNCWMQDTDVWTDINKRKPVFVEGRNKEEFNRSMENYRSCVRQSLEQRDAKGAVFMAVCRGKISEGLDFVDDYARAVIIIGLPYAPFKDPKVELKKQYLNVTRGKTLPETNQIQEMSGNDWYQLEAYRSVNQAVGRVIRHKDDYGAIIFCDQRFNSDLSKKKLPKWLQENLRALKHTKQATASLRDFFSRIRGMKPPSAPKRSIPDVMVSLTACKGVPAETIAPSQQVKKRIKLVSNFEPIRDETEREQAMGRQGESGQPMRVQENSEQPITRFPIPDRFSFKHQQQTREFMNVMKAKLKGENYKVFCQGLRNYKEGTINVRDFVSLIGNLFEDGKLRIEFLKEVLMSGIIKTGERDQFNLAAKVVGKALR